MRRLKKRNNEISKHKSALGFTLLEVIVAIFILSVGVGGTFSLISQTLSIASVINLKLIGSYLAQEGIEIVKNLRDKAWLEQGVSPGTPWDIYLPVGDWEVDYLTQDLTDRGYLDPGVPMNIDSNGFYGYGPGNPTKFIRKISIQPAVPIGTVERLKVIVQVKWTERGRAHSVDVLEYITNWYEQ